MSNYPVLDYGRNYMEMSYNLLLIFCTFQVKLVHQVLVIGEKLNLCQHAVTRSIRKLVIELKSIKMHQKIRTKILLHQRIHRDRHNRTTRTPQLFLNWEWKATWASGGTRLIKLTLLLHAEEFSWLNSVNHLHQPSLRVLWDFQSTLWQVQQTVK